DEIRAAGLRDNEALVLAIEQLDAELFLQRLDLMADGALCQAQLFGRAREAAVAGGSLERPEGIEYGKATTHGQPSLKKNGKDRNPIRLWQSFRSSKFQPIKIRGGTPKNDALHAVTNEHSSRRIGLSTQPPGCKKTLRPSAAPVLAEDR